VCDHLIVVDNEKRRFDGAPKIVGAYRLLRQEVAQANFGFYSAAEFDVGALIARHPSKRFLELGRSCVAQGYRGKRTVELLWRGIWTYARWHRVDAMFGCASLPGIEPGAHAAALRFLRSDAEVDSAWTAEPVRPEASRGHDDAPALDARAALRELPPLIKGYWRLGAQFSASAVVDRTFGTTDIFVVLPVADIEQRYLAYFAPKDAEPPMAA
jgi:putative hemolysin